MADMDTATLRRVAKHGSMFGRHVVVASLAAIGLAAVSGTPAASAHGGCAGAHRRISHTPRPVVQAAVVCLVNRQRTRRHLPRLHENAHLNRSAQGWTNVMVRAHAFSHGSNFSARISAVGFHWSMVGENIAAGYDTPASVVRAWMASPGHCRNILSPSFLDVGTGVSQGSVAGSPRPGTWTQDFGLPMGHHQPSVNTGPASGCPY
ncbi:MAG: CAP domain-containing protein [Solirubrobacteraceae bacterium]